MRNNITFINPLNWQVKDGIILENNAEEVVRSSSNHVIIAGPGAGKTELLAQKACYLLETDSCTAPKKILAISFKKDAAENLADRVNSRCGKELARRFESMTYDSFAKHLLDHFRLAINEKYRPSKDYRLLLKDSELADIADKYLPVLYPHFPNWRRVIRRNSDLANLLCNMKLPLPPLKPDDSIQVHINLSLWGILIKGTFDFEGGLTFPMISRIADYLLRENRYIRNALRTTYSHVFLDEFQDTTDIQYSLLKTSFLGSKSTITAVGDEKQRIMVWARAQKGIFNHFKIDFQAIETQLFMNYRSSPKLVTIQNIVSKNLEENSAEVIVTDKWGELEGICEIWAFKNHEEEAIFLANEVINWINIEGIKPRDICIIVKQHEDIYGEAFKRRLAVYGVQAREEKEYQDLLSEEIVNIILNMITLAVKHQAPDARKNTIDFLFYINGFDESTKYELLYESEDQLSKFLLELKIKLLELDKLIVNEAALQKVVSSIIEFFDPTKIKNSFPKYSRGDYFDNLINEITMKIQSAYQIRKDWGNTVEDIYGNHSIPMMTIHKSKGLEYDTVIFIGLEDAAFWNFNNNSEEDKRAFFVALSRAKRRVIFTASKVRRVLNRERHLENIEQSVQNITTLYKILKDAGVSIIRPKLKNDIS
ncbi:ATP-dependent helicase [Paenibacillus oralis]|uniref:DNA 3'-5' helicase n=1 Tax=Paenibacillus oralis TaxID=2490856 RepID=A0A3P3U6T9_9BACL|nr:ATP-dependent helicase [Paenibacillus oralis]RRJ66081.1 ATP-dependent helicase [Paenibacillus oralis]